MALAFTTAAVLGATPAPAQVIDLGGRGGPSIDLRSDRQRNQDIRREERRRDRDYDRRRDATGSVGRCREVTVRERDDYGRMVTRRTRDCD